MSELMDILRRSNYDDRAEKLGSRNRDKASAALEGMSHRTQDSKIVRFALTKLPKVESF